MKILSASLYRLPASSLSAEVRNVCGIEKTDAPVLKAVARVSLPTFKARLKVGNKVYPDAFNLREPYDRKTHVFYLPGDTRLPAAARLFCRPWPVFGKRLSLSDAADAKAAGEAAESGWTAVSSLREDLADGLVFEQLTLRNRDGAQVVASLLTADPERVSFIVGTANDGEAPRKARATIPDMIAAAEAHGHTVLAAVNADFFDIFGDFHPSGLCVKNGHIVANGDSLRPFLGLTKDGRFVITDLEERPEILPSLKEAAAGMQRIIKNGGLFDLAPGEPFGYTPHPRTAAGVTKEGKLLLLEVDGRIPAHSNGATLTDLALFLQSRGAYNAVNLDGGGSSAVYTRDDAGQPKLRTVPADLFKPNDMLIRKDFNAILILNNKEER